MNYERESYNNNENINYSEFRNVTNKYNIYFLEYMFYSVILISFGYNLYKICNPKLTNCMKYFKLKTLNNYKLKNDLLDTCSICLSDLLCNEKVIKLNCNHIFHKDCIIAWLKKDTDSSCPLCRNNI